MTPEPTWLPLTAHLQAPRRRLAQAIPVHSQCLSPRARPHWTSLSVPLLFMFTAGLIPLRLPPPLLLFIPIWAVQNVL